MEKKRLIALNKSNMFNIRKIEFSRHPSNQVIVHPSKCESAIWTSNQVIVRRLLK